MAVEVIERLEDLAALRFAQHIQQMTHKRRILQIKTKIKNITHKQSCFKFLCPKSHYSQLLSRCKDKQIKHNHQTISHKNFRIYTIFPTIAAFYGPKNSNFEHHAQ